MLTAEIIAVGSELLTPEKTDTNSLWLTEKLNDIGIEVMLKTIVGDDEARLEEAFRDALKRADVVISTGGLGPTEDDITRQVAARAVDRKLVYHEEIEEILRERFKNWGREMPESNKRQAWAIEGAEILPNPNGSAAGMMLMSGDKFLVLLPGPPRENQRMFTDFVYARLKEAAGNVCVRRRLLRVVGMGESALDERIAPLYTTRKDIQTSILFNRTEVEVHLSSKSGSADAAQKAVDELADEIIKELGTAVFSTHGETMEEVVGEMLASRGKTLSVAESCTGGLIAMRLTEIAGSSRYFMEGVVSYSNDAKIRILNVPAEILEKHGAVSAETAEAMARGMRDRAQTDYAISVTGIAGPDGGTDEKPVGTVFIGFADDGACRSMKFTFPGDRYLIRWRASQAALDLLRRQMLR
jgi:nicotinamide-nucleotide amidase